MMRRPGIPIFFRLWFAFVALLAISIMVATVTVLLNPQWIGSFVGQIVTGYQQTVTAPADPPPIGS